jgi:beta-barrel assembly-enhancing protease
MLSLAIFLAAASPQNATQTLLDQIRSADQTVTTIGYRLATKGAPLCPSGQVPLAGLRVHVLGQYAASVRRDAETLFGLADYPAILAIAPGSAAANAGAKPGDWIVSIDGIDMRPAPAAADYAAIERFDAALEAALAQPPVTLITRREGKDERLQFTGTRGCASRIELVPDKKRNAAADGKIVQITTGVLSETQSDDELAFIIAHEMSHNILKHRDRLDRLGRSAKAIRETEIEADRLGLQLMAAAGYDPLAAARFWERFGRKTGSGIFSDGTHMRTKARVAFLRIAAAGLKTAQ